MKYNQTDCLAWKDGEIYIGPSIYHFSLTFISNVSDYDDSRIMIHNIRDLMRFNNQWVAIDSAKFKPLIGIGDATLKKWKVFNVPLTQTFHPSANWPFTAVGNGFLSYVAIDLSYHYYFYFTQDFKTWKMIYTNTSLQNTQMIGAIYGENLFVYAFNRKNPNNHFSVVYHVVEKTWKICDINTFTDLTSLTYHSISKQYYISSTKYDSFSSSDGCHWTRSSFIIGTNINQLITADKYVIGVGASGTTVAFNVLNI